MSIQLIQRAAYFGRKTAIISGQKSYTYEQLQHVSQQCAQNLLNYLQTDHLQQARIAFLCPPGFNYVVLQWAVWQAGGVTVPLCITHPLPELLYVIADCGAEACIIALDFVAIQDDLLANAPNLTKFISLSSLNTPASNPNNASLPAHIDTNMPAMMLYTSGTTGRPKGVILTHRNIEAQIICLIRAWQWTDNDSILHFLPLHHTHGIINKLCCALWAGATVEFMSKFDAASVWQRLTQGGISVFMAVPTIYSLLIKHFEQGTAREQQQWQEACAALRLMVSGSAALPISLWQRWQAISGHALLERYGMTEIGMALSNPYIGTRIPGFVGRPLEGVSVKIVDDSGQAIEQEGVSGELWVSGENVFAGYWNKPQETEKSFCENWFRTGDIVMVENGQYKIVGRRSTDIIKTGGYKVSALEIEDVLLTHNDIGECAVVSVPDDVWGERVAVAVVSRSGQQLTLEEVRTFAAHYLAAYKLPSLLLNLLVLPRNAIGKVTKVDVRNLFLG